MSILEYFRDDPIRILTVIGGSGGLYFWYDKFKNRTRIKIQVITHGHGFIENPHFVFEATNRGKEQLVIESPISLTGHIPPCMIHRKKKSRFNLKKFDFDIVPENSRTLEPMVPKKFKALCHKRDEYFIMLTFGVFKIRILNYGVKRVRVRSSCGERLGWFKFNVERLLYYFFGWVKTG